MKKYRIYMATAEIHKKNIHSATLTRREIVDELAQGCNSFTDYDDISEAKKAYDAISASTTIKKNAYPYFYCTGAILSEVEIDEDENEEENIIDTKCEPVDVCDRDRQYAKQLTRDIEEDEDPSDAIKELCELAGVDTPEEAKRKFGI